jgi:hypothetical protein
MYVFCIYLETNIDFCPIQNKLIFFYNREEKCLQSGTDWVFKQSGLRFVFKGLILSFHGLSYRLKKYRCLLCRTVHLYSYCHVSHVVTTAQEVWGTVPEKGEIHRHGTRK